MVRRPKFSQASQFDQLAKSFLSSLGFELDADPDEIQGAYLQTHAIYRSERGFYLMIWFQPTDGSGAGITCGRRWDAPLNESDFDWYVLSNGYSRLAKRFGFNLPDTYQLGYGVGFDETAEAILDDLRKTLLLILQRVSLDDLLSIEGEAGGAEERVASTFGQDYIRKMEISEFRDESGNS